MQTDGTENFTEQMHDLKEPILVLDSTLKKLKARQSRKPNCAKTNLFIF